MVFEKSKQNIATAFFSAVVLFFLNLYFTEWFVSNNFFPLTKNFGFVFSIPISLPIIYIVTIVILGVLSWIYIFYFFRRGIIFSLGFGLIFGGAISNLYFRVYQGFVWDYFHLVFIDLRGAWNIADVGIILGMVFWLIGSNKKHGTKS